MRSTLILFQRLSPLQFSSSEIKYLSIVHYNPFVVFSYSGKFKQFCFNCVVDDNTIEELDPEVVGNLKKAQFFPSSSNLEVETYKYSKTFIITQFFLFLFINSLSTT